MSEPTPDEKPPLRTYIIEENTPAAPQCQHRYRVIAEQGIGTIRYCTRCGASWIMAALNMDSVGETTGKVMKREIVRMWWMRIEEEVPHGTN